MPHTDVSLFLQPRAPLPETDRLLLAAAVTRVCAVDLAAVTIEQRCERCGGAHGRPRVLAPSGIFVSLSRADSAVVVAVSLAGPIGVDIESLAAVDRAGFDDVAFNAFERSQLAGLPAGEQGRARAVLWTTKEALLKLSGEGLTVDPRELTVGLVPGGASALQSWPTATLDLAQVHVAGFDVGLGLVGTLAVLGPSAPSVSVL
ncbi:4'-phosphopantetheinyl transferase superfamily protein [Cryobacterium sp. PH31-L1]|uniref:4'-phosphopantetheinyl transferase family protein n=1 Tax=Cryobacterium sp. PH31-L1 TaxID=3046199 RepID=UPI0024B8B0BF|nr:4'-phosphopantetheinyl transferase superfamily protein [Cryobacterium sp. PH31-L1]MDJ0377085.1 4'-phosphopantetheinyl transferase superfamily protein [Cryobacterium sp. PH31-L1]